MATKQELFSMAYIGLAGQGFERALELGGGIGCAYRGENGRKCAIGYCIPDDKYDPAFEGRSAIFDATIREAAGAENVGAQFVSFLQDCHDSTDNPDDMKQQLQQFAAKYDLTIPAIEVA